MPAQIIEKWQLCRNVVKAPFFLICKACRKKSVVVPNAYSHSVYTAISTNQNYTFLFYPTTH